MQRSGLKIPNFRLSFRCCFNYVHNCDKIITDQWFGEQRDRRKGGEKIIMYENVDERVVGR